MQYPALMNKLSRFPAAVGSHASRGGKSALGCSRCRSQRTICTPRSMPTRIRLWRSAPAFAFHRLPGKPDLSGKVGAASSFFLSSPRKPNPALKRTSHGKPWSVRLAQRWANARSGPHAQAVSLSRRSRFARLARRHVRSGLLARPLAAHHLYAALYARTHSPLALGTGFCLPPSHRPAWSVGQGQRGKFLLPLFTT